MTSMKRFSAISVVIGLFLSTPTATHAIPQCNTAGCAVAEDDRENHIDITALAHGIAAGLAREGPNPFACDDTWVEHPEVIKKNVAQIAFYRNDDGWQHVNLREGGCDVDLKKCMGVHWKGSVASSTNPDVASVDPTGVIRRHAERGFTLITVKSRALTKFIYVDVTFTDPLGRDSEFVDLTRDVSFKRKGIHTVPDRSVLYTEEITITNNGSLPLASEHAVLALKNLPVGVVGARICPGQGNLGGGRAYLRFPKEFLFPGESESFRLMFYNFGNSAIDYDPKLYLRWKVVKEEVDASEEPAARIRP